MTLRELASAIGARGPAAADEVPVRGLAWDSRRVAAGDLFFAIPGGRHDGTAFVAPALAAGAVAAVARAGAAEPAGRVLQVEDPRLAMAQAACRFHGDPSRELDVIAVTGTNGKTTTTWLLESILAAAGRRPGVIGTTGVRYGGRSLPSAFTTPEAPELQGLLRAMRDHGVDSVAMEVSSHALEQRRAFGLEPAVAVFTNLSRDHLDYHGTLEAYLDAKLRLFDGRNADAAERPLVAVINQDDPVAPRVRSAAAHSGAGVVLFGEGEGCDPRITAIAARPGGLALTFAAGSRRHAFTLPLLGRYNAWNAAAAWAAARGLGVADEAIVRGLEAAPAVPGRLERVAAGQPFEVVVDYAHTPDALARALAAVREHGARHVRVVFGCGGDRDRGKRPEMGAVARDGADEVWVTSDNPRSEDPAAIAAEVAAGAGPRAHVVLDRRAAIGAALSEARPGDAVLIAGKGHETTQTIGDRVLPFDDRAVAREWLGGRPA